MTWSTTISVIALFIATGKFIDTYHNKSKLIGLVTNRLRDVLVRFYFFLLEIKITQIAKPALGLVVGLRYLFYVGFVLLITFAWLGHVALAFLFGNAIIPLDWLLVLIFIGCVVLFLTFSAFRLCVNRLSDIPTGLIVLIIPPLLIYWGISIIGAINSLIPNTAGLYFSIATALSYVIACIPMAILLLVVLVIIVLKFITITLRWLGLHVSEVASDPKGDPFTYFSALSAVLVLAYKTVTELL